jgi:NADP-dependent 3-hydroxy acid dehydrogenase YdfG
MKTAIITGGSKGIGFAIAALFVEKNINVAICARNEAQLNKATQKLQSLNSNATVISFACDVSDKQQIKSFAEFVLDKFETIDILVNNAGVFLPGKTYEEEDGTLEKLIETNLYSAYYMNKAIVPSMKAKKSGHVFNICSVASLIALPNGGSYSISKFAMLGMGKVLRLEMQPYNVRVTNVMPGATLTPSFDGIELPAERFMKPEDVAKAIFDIYSLSERTVVEDIVLRPQLGDL